jgi:hypothetical protein
MPRLVRAPDRTIAQAIARITRETARLDAWSFWTVPADDHVVVAGTTGVFLIVPEIHDGMLDVAGRRVRVGGRSVALRPLRAAVRRLHNRLGTGAVGVEIEPVLCLVQATAGAPLTVRGVRVVPVGSLASDLARREKVLPPTRAQRVVRNLGMTVAGDHRRLAAVLRGRPDVRR